MKYPRGEFNPYFGYVNPERSGALPDLTPEEIATHKAWLNLGPDEWGVEIPRYTDEDFGIPELDRETVGTEIASQREYLVELTSRVEPLSPLRHMISGDPRTGVILSSAVGVTSRYEQTLGSRATLLDNMRPSTVVWLTSRGGHILEVLGGLDNFATEWQAHILRSEAASLDKRYKKDAALREAYGYRLLAQATFGEVVRGGIYFQDALVAVYNNRCTDAQLQLVLNELHPELKYRYGLYRPRVKDALGMKVDPGRQVLQAKHAVWGYVNGPYERMGVQPLDITHMPGNNLTRARLAAEAALFQRTVDLRLPEAIRAVVAHRLITAVSSPRVADRKSETLVGKQLKDFLGANPDFRRAYQEASLIDDRLKRRPGRADV